MNVTRTRFKWHFLSCPFTATDSTPPVLFSPAEMAPRSRPTFIRKKAESRRVIFNDGQRLESIAPRDDR